MRHGFDIILIPTLILVAACDSKPEAAPEPTPDQVVQESEAQQEQAEEVIASSEELTEAQEFVDRIVAINTLQIGLADILLRDGDREDVADFAEMMVEDHRRLLADLKAAAAETSPDLVFNTSLPEDKEGELAEMRGALNADDMFLERVRAGNREIMAAIDDEIANGTYPALVDWANAAKTDAAAHADALSTL